MCYRRSEQWHRNEIKRGGGVHRSGAIVGGTDLARSDGKNFLVVALYFLALKVQLVVLVNAFVTVSTVWSVFCSLFFY